MITITVETKPPSGGSYKIAVVTLAHILCSSNSSTNTVCAKTFSIYVSSSRSKQYF